MRRVYNSATQAVKHPLFSGSALMIGGSMVANVVNYFYHLLMGRVLGPKDYGTLASIYAVMYILSIVPTSTSFAIVKFISSAGSKVERTGIFLRLRKLVFQIAVVLSLVFLVLSPVVSNFLHIENVYILVLVSLVLFFSLMTLVYQATFQGILQFGNVVVPALISSIGKFVLGIGLVLIGWSVFGAIMGVLLAAMASYWYVLKMSDRIGLTKKAEDFKIRPFLEYSFPVLVQALAFTSIFTIDLVLVKHFLPAYEAGLYASLATLGKIIYFATQPMALVMFPIVAGKKSRGERYRKIFYWAFLYVLVMGVGITIFYYLFPGVAIGILYGKAYLAAKSELVWMGMFMSIYTASYLVVSFLLSIGRTRVVVVPLMVSVIQLIGILRWHGNILEVIQVSLVAVVVLFGCLSLYLGNYWLRRRYG